MSRAVGEVSKVEQIRRAGPAANGFNQLKDHYMFRGDGTMEWDKVMLLFRNVEGWARESEREACASHGCQRCRTVK